MSIEQLTKFYNSELSDSCKKYLKPSIEINSDFTVSQTISSFHKRKEIFFIFKNTPYVLRIRDLLNKKKINPDMNILQLSNPIKKLTSGDKLSSAAKVMYDSKIFSVPIVEKNMIVGEVRLKDIFQKLRTQESSWISIEQFMTKPLSLSSSDSISKARAFFLSNNYDFVPVGKPKIKRVLSSYDILDVLNPPQRVGSLGTRGKQKIRSLENNISNMGSKDIHFCKPKDSLYDVLGTLTKTNSLILVQGDRKVIGLIHPLDILALSAQKVRSVIPLFITGKKEEIPSSSVGKIASTMRKYSKIISEVQEVRLSIDTTNTGGKETKYHLSLTIFALQSTETFSSSGWSFYEVIKDLLSKIDRKISQKQKPLVRKTRRKQRIF